MLFCHYQRQLYSHRVGHSVASVCLFVCPRFKRKTAWAINTKLGTHICIVVAWHALTHRSKGQRSRSHGYKNCHGRAVASDTCCYSCMLLMPAWVCMSIRLPVFSSYFLDTEAFVGCFRFLHVMWFIVYWHDTVNETWLVMPQTVKWMLNWNSVTFPCHDNILSCCSNYISICILPSLSPSCIIKWYVESNDAADKSFCTVDTEISPALISIFHAQSIFVTY